MVVENTFQGYDSSIQKCQCITKQEIPPMSHVLAICAAFLFASSAIANDKPKPNTLTPKEIADGWILLFDGETTYGWKAIEFKDGKKAEISVKDGCLVISG